MKNISFIFLIIIAIQVSCKKSEDLSSFVKMNDKIEAANDISSIKNESLLEVIYLNADKNEALFPQKETAERVHEVSSNFIKYLEDLKIAIKIKNSSEYVDELFFNGEEITTEGMEFLNYIENYKTSLISTVISTHTDVAGVVKNNFDIGSIKDRRGKQTSWLVLNYKGFPATSSIIKLSEMQSDVKRIETKFYSSLLDVKLKDNNEIFNKSDRELANNDKINSDEEKTTDTDLKEEVKKEDSVSEKEVEKKEPIEEDKVTINEKEKIEPKKEETKEPNKKIVPKLAKSTNTSNPKIHEVEKKETIYSISQKYGLTTVQLKRLNGMTNSNLVIGQKLRIKK